MEYDRKQCQQTKLYRVICWLSSFNAGKPGKLPDYQEGVFYDKGEQTQFWSTLEYGMIQAWVWGLYDNDSKFVCGYNYKKCGFSIRCVKNVVH